MNTARTMRKLCTTLTSSLAMEVPVDPQKLFRALCDRMSETQNGRRIILRFESFPTELSTSGLWLNMADHDIIVVEKDTTPEHQLVILGHELWHMKRGVCGHHANGAAAAARSLSGEDQGYLAIAARSHYDIEEEIEAESFGLLLGDKCGGWLSKNGPGAIRGNDVAGRIGNALGYRGTLG